MALALLALGGCSSAQLATHGAKSAARSVTPMPRPAGSAIDRHARGSYKVGKPYQIEGIWYRPKVEPDYDVTGVASWYGPAFHGKRTANGAVYDMHALTAAHKTLPMPSKVRVTNLENGRSVVVEINDRGPFVNGRIIDMSYRAAQLLGFDKSGLATVRVQTVTDENRLFVVDRPVTPAIEQRLAAAAPTVPVDISEINAPAGYVAVRRPVERAVFNAQPLLRMFVQAGAFSVAGNATKLGHRLTPIGPVRILAGETGDGRNLYRVQVGPYSDVESADEALRGLIRDGHRDAVLVVD